jgi:hypothetical protein
MTFHTCKNCNLENRMTRRRINRRFAKSAFGEGYGDMTPAERAARKAWLADNRAREAQLADVSGMGNGYDAVHASMRCEDEQQQQRGPLQRRTDFERRFARPTEPGSARPLFSRAVLDSLLHLGEDAAHAVAKQRFACTPALVDFRLRYRQRKAALCDKSA